MRRRWGICLSIHLEHGGREDDVERGLGAKVVLGGRVRALCRINCLRKRRPLSGAHRTVEKEHVGAINEILSAGSSRVLGRPIDLRARRPRNALLFLELTAGDVATQCPVKCKIVPSYIGSSVHQLRRGDKHASGFSERKVGRIEVEYRWRAEGRLTQSAISIVKR